VELTINEGPTVVVEARRPTIVDGVQQERLRAPCGSKVGAERCEAVAMEFSRSGSSI
jgi:hypothetical protein